MNYYDCLWHDIVRAETNPVVSRDLSRYVENRAGKGVTMGVLDNLLGRLWR